MAKVITICDRKADIIEYLAYNTMNQQRFVIRSLQNRRQEESKDKLYTFSGTLQPAGERKVQVRQRGGAKPRRPSVRCSMRRSPADPAWKTGRACAALLCRLSGNDR
ncbi:hypothetical protein KKJ10_13820 [Xenorhabdus bovienii]|nr:hypothetical protein [Xenorhabdus bovienii]MDE9441526.1 hypothetical protein [Xenorhabdus bovienii]MDE9491014.1 hypothetical protein [Xenorhabdus bovienii]MDE9507332.1 hypothetical protein [Xenorhabdus bovienii]MDE9539926.1 hypothetical protein [Xenorhabdus bovienii]